jgi:hypothetical protein
LRQPSLLLLLGWPQVLLVCRHLGTRERITLRREEGNLRCTDGRFETCGPPRSARPASSKEPSCSEIEVIIRDFESGLGRGVFADDFIGHSAQRDGTAVKRE